MATIRKGIPLVICGGRNGGVIYNSFKLIPAPFVSLSKDMQTNEDGKIVGTLFSITLKGSLIAHRGTPRTDGTFVTFGYPEDEDVAENEKLSALIYKQTALRKLFGREGLLLEIEGYDGCIPFRCNPRVKRFEFPEGGQGRVSWVDKCDYTIQLEADKIYGKFGNEEEGDPANYKVSKSDEQWTVEIADERVQTQRLTHSVSATGKRFYLPDGTLEMEAWEQARRYVLNRIGLGIDAARLTAPSVLDNTVSAYNYIRSQHVGETNGTFQVSEQWLCFAPTGVPAIEEGTINIRESAEGRVTVSMDGTITGLEERNNSTYVLTTSKYNNAFDMWDIEVRPNLFTRAAAAAGTTLHASPNAFSYGINQRAGVISYQAEYDDRPTPATSGAVSEIIEIVNNNQADIYATIPVLGRTAGPILQDIVTNTAKRRSIHIEVVMPAKSQTYTPTAPNTTTIVTANMPGGTVFMDSDEERWNAYTGRYSRTTQFTWE